MRSPYLLAALGNPGLRYSRTRHNAGFLLADALMVRHDSLWTPDGADALICHLPLHGADLLVVKPQTFMNLSGGPIARLSRQLDIPLEHIAVVHDDLDLPLGRFKISQGRGAGGHRGILSIIDGLGSRDFGRMRIGIGRPPDAVIPADYVLSDFSDAELSIISGSLPRLEHALELFLRDDLTRAMNVINSPAGVV